MLRIEDGIELIYCYHFISISSWAWKFVVTQKNHIWLLCMNAFWLTHRCCFVWSNFRFYWSFVFWFYWLGFGWSTFDLDWSFLWFFFYYFLWLFWLRFSRHNLTWKLSLNAWKGLWRLFHQSCLFEILCTLRRLSSFRFSCWLFRHVL